MGKRDRELDERVGKLLRAGKPAYPEDLDSRLRGRLAVLAPKRAEPGPSAWPRWRWALPALAGALLLVIGLWRRPAAGPEPPRAVPGLAQQVVGPRPLPPPPVVAATTPGPAVAPQVARPRRAVCQPGTVPPASVRLEFTIPERSITILWEQRSDFDLAALVAAR